MKKTITESSLRAISRRELKQRLFKENSGDIITKRLQGHSYDDIVLEMEDNINIAKITVDGDEIVKFVYGGSGTTKIISINEKEVLDVLSDIIWMYGK